MKQDEHIIHEMNKRFDRLEAKLDAYTEHTAAHKQDINWIKGVIKIGLSAVVAVAGAVATYILKHIS